jgi:hypothetical protein
MEAQVTDLGSSSGNKCDKSPLYGYKSTQKGVLLSDD